MSEHGATNPTDWRKSRASGSGDCVEVSSGAAIHVRNSKAPDAGTAVFTQSEWKAFVAGVRAGEFDLDADGRLPLLSNYS